MATYYVVYARQNHKALRYVKESHFRQHLISLRNVFLVCGGIHVLSSAVSWVVPIYYIVAACMLLNAVQCHWLLSSKREIQAIRRYYQGEIALEAIENARRLIAEAQAEGIGVEIRRLKEALRGVK